MIQTTHIFPLQQGMASQPIPPLNLPPLENKGLMFGLIKGNQWLISPHHKAGYFWEGEYVAVAVGWLTCDLVESKDRRFRRKYSKSSSGRSSPKRTCTTMRNLGQPKNPGFFSCSQTQKKRAEKMEKKGQQKHTQRIQVNCIFACI